MAVLVAALFSMIAPVKAQTSSPNRFRTLDDAVAAGAVSASTVADVRAHRRPRVIVQLDAAVEAAALDVATVPAATEQTAADTNSEDAQRIEAPTSLDQDGASPRPSTRLDGNVLRHALDNSKRPILATTAPLTDRRHDFANLSAFSASVKSEAGLLRLVNTAGVERLSPNERFTESLDSSLPAIGQPAAVAAGYTGVGTYVAVLDTGVDYTRSAFGSCVSPGVPATCRVAELPSDFTTDDFGNPYSDNQLDDPCGNQHGTNVSGIVAGTAPQTKLIVGDVFEWVNSTGNLVPPCTAGAVSKAFTEDLLSGIDSMVGRKTAGVNIVALNLSLGGSSKFTGACPDTFHFGMLRTAGIQPIVAAGNSAKDPSTGIFADGVSSPACIAGAVPVGAVYDSGAPTTFSQSAALPNMIWGPGYDISAAGVLHFSGTSMASPHVAGAFAAASGARPGWSLDQRIALLRDSSNSTTNLYVARTERVLNMAAMTTYLAIPPNDNRANATPVGAGVISTFSYSATIEPGEVNHGGIAPHQTVWFRYVMNRNGYMDVAGTSNVGLYGGLLTSCPSFYGQPNCARVIAVAGTAVEIALSNPPSASWVNSASISEGNLYSNDDPASPTALGGSAVIDLTYANATVGERVAPGVTSTRTRYYQLSAGSPTTLQFFPASVSSPMPDIAVFDSSLSNTSKAIARNKHGQSIAGPFAAANVLIQIASVDATSGTLTVSAASPSDSSDNSATPAVLTGASGALDLRTVTATPTVDAGFDRDVWARFTAPSSGLFHVSTSGSNVDTELCATSPVRTDCIGDEVALDAGLSDVALFVQSGTIVNIRAGIPVGGVGQGTIHLTWRLDPERSVAPAAVTVTSAVPRAAAPVGGTVGGGARTAAPRGT